MLCVMCITYGIIVEEKLLLHITFYVTQKEQGSHKLIHTHRPQKKRKKEMKWNRNTIVWMYNRIEKQGKPPKKTKG